jgi:Transglycosylase SLT domain
MSLATDYGIRSLRPDKRHTLDSISRAAKATGVDFGYLLQQAKVESGLNPFAKARTSSASGLFQFLDQTWLSIVKRHGAQSGIGWAQDAITRNRSGHLRVADPEARRAILSLRNDPEISSMMAAKHARDNQAELAGSLSRTPNATDLYFAHFLGLAGARSFLRAADANPDGSASAEFPKEAAANRSIFFSKTGASRSFSKVYALMGQKMGRLSAPSSDQSGNMLAGLTKTPPPGVLINEDDLHKMTGDIASALSVPPTMLRPDPRTARLAYLMVSSSGMG